MNINGAKLGVYLRKTPKWIPKKWKGKYTQMVIMSAQGHSNAAIANLFRMTSQQVCNVLGLPEAVRMREEICSNLEATLREDIHKTLEQVGRKAVDRIKAVINDDQLFEHNPLAIFDRSRVLLQATGILKGTEHSNGGVSNNTTNVMIGNDASEILVQALIKSQRIRDSNMITGGPPSP